MSKRAIIYVRVSTVRQQDGLSLEAQEEDARRYCQAHGFTVIEVVTEVHSGTDLDERPVLLDLRTRFGLGLFDVLVVWRYDRLSRDQMHQAVILYEAQKHNITVLSSTEQLDESPVGQFMRHALAFAAQVEHQAIRTRSMRSKNGLVDRGYLFPTHTARYGYSFADASKRTYIPNPETAPIVVRIFTLVAGGMSGTAVMRLLNAEGVPAPRGGTWKISAVNALINNPAYIGEAQGRVSRVVHEQRSNLLPGQRAVRRQLLPAEERQTLPSTTVPALVPKELALRAQSTLANYHVHTTGPGPDYLLKGIVTCGYCGRAVSRKVMQLTFKRGHKTYTRSERSRYGYTCRHHNHPDPKSLPGTFVLRARFDEEVWAIVEKVLEDPSILEKHAKRLQGKHQQPTGSEVEALQAQLARITKQRGVLQMAVAGLEDDEDIDVLVGQLNSLSDDAARIRKRLAEVVALQVTWEQAQDNVARLVQWCREVNREDLSFDDKRRVLYTLGVHVTLWSTDHDPRYEVSLEPFDDDEQDSGENAPSTGGGGTSRGRAQRNPLLLPYFMPVSVAVNRDNTIDSILALTVVVAAWAATLATERASWRWLLLCAALVGIGFNVKMLEAYLVVPAFAVMYLLGAPTSWRARFGHLALAGVVLLALTFSWMTIVDSIPALQRPYVGSSATNSETELAFGYNGLERLLGRGGPARPAGGNNANAGFAPGETGGVGPLRLFNESLGGQSAWLLPVALMAMLAGAIIVVQRSVPLVRGRAPRDALAGTWGAFVTMRLTPQQSAYVMWGMWLLTCAGFFSVAGFFHAYYLSIMAPAIAALVGIGLVALWRLFTGPTWLGWLLPITLVVTAYAQGKLLAPYSDYHWLTVIVLVVGILGALVLTWVRLSRVASPPTRVQEGNAKLAALRQRVNMGRLPQWSALAVLGVAVFALLLAPAAWTVATVNSPQGMIPNAGPGRAFTFNFAGGDLRVSNATVNAAMRNFGGGGTNAQLIAYLTKHQAGARYLVATLNANSAAPYILATGKPVMAIGGFSGGDPILTLSQLQHLIATNQVRFFLGQGARTGGTGDRFGTGRSGTSPGRNFGGIGGFGGNANAALSQWVQQSCTLVPALAYGGKAPTSGSGFPGGALPPVFPDVGRGGFPGGGFGEFGGAQLYDCSSHVLATANK